jgi:hypothetical protein
LLLIQLVNASVNVKQGITLKTSNNAQFTLGFDAEFYKVELNNTFLWLDKSYSMHHYTRYCIYTVSPTNTQFTIDSWFTSTSSTAQLTITSPTSTDINMGFTSPNLITATVTGEVTETWYPTNKTLRFTVNTATSTTFTITAEATETDTNPIIYSTQLAPVFAYEMGEFIRQDTAPRYLLFDSSTNKNYGTFDSTSEAPTQAIGKLGYGLLFDGVNDWANVSSSSSMQLWTLETICVWINLNVENKTQGIIYKDGEYDLYVRSDGKVEFRIYNGEAWYASTSTTTLDVGTWYFIIAELYINEINIYIDNTLENTTELIGGYTTTSNNVEIGRRHGADYFSGIIDELQGYHRLLDSTEKGIVKITQISSPSNYIFTTEQTAPNYSILQTYYEQGIDNWAFYGATWQAQTFTTSEPINYTVTIISLKMYRAGNPGTVTVSIRATDTNGHPSGSDLTSGSLNGNSFTTDTNGAWYNFTLTPYTLSQLTKYAIVVRATAGGSSNYVVWIGAYSSGTYPYGNAEYSTTSGSTWGSQTTADMTFKVYGYFPSYGYVDNHIETPWASNGANVTVDYYLMGFNTFHSLITIDQYGGTSSNAYFLWSYSFYKAGAAEVVYQLKICYTSLTDKTFTLTFQQYMPQTGTTTIMKTVNLNMNGTGKYARAWKVAIDACNYMDEKTFQIRVASDTSEQAVLDTVTGNYWWEYFFNLVDRNGNPVNINYYDPFVKVSVLVKSDTGITTMIKEHTHLAWFVWLVLIAIAATIVGAVGTLVYVMTGGRLSDIPIIGGALQAAADWMSTLANLIATALTPIGTWIVNAFIAAMSPVFNALVQVGQALWSVVVQVMDTLLSFTGNAHLFTDIINFLGTLATNIGNAFTFIGTLLVQGFTLLAAFFNNVATILTSFVGTFVSMWNYFNQILGGAYGVGVDFWNMAAPVLPSLLTLLAIGYVIWLIVLWEERGLGAVIDHFRGLFDIATFILGTLLHIAQVFIQFVNGLIEALPF